MAGSRQLGNGTSGRRRLAAACTAVVVVLAAGIGAIAYGRNGGDDRSGLAMTGAGEGPGVDVPPDLPTPEEILAAVQAAQAAAGGPVPQVTAPSTATAEPAIGDPPIPRPVLPDLAGFPAADPEPGTGQALVTIANDYPGPVVVKVNDQSYELAAGERVGPVEVTPAPSGNDVIEATMTTEPTCGVGDAQAYFRAGGSYMLTLYSGPGNCNFRVTPA